MRVGVCRSEDRYGLMSRGLNAKGMDVMAKREKREKVFLTSVSWPR